MGKSLPPKLLRLKSMVTPNMDPYKSVKGKELILKHIGNNPDDLRKLTNRKFRRSIIKGGDLNNTTISKKNILLDKAIKSKYPNFKPNKYKAIGAISGSIAGVGAMAGLSVVDPVLVATPGVGPTSMATYGLMIGTGVDKIRINKLSKSDKLINKHQISLNNSVTTTNKQYKQLMRKARSLNKSLRNKKSK